MAFYIIKMTRLKKKKKKRKGMAITVIKPRCTIVSSQFSTRECPLISRCVVLQCCTFRGTNERGVAIEEHWIEGTQSVRNQDFFETHDPSLSTLLSDRSKSDMLNVRVVWLCCPPNKLLL